MPKIVSLNEVYNRNELPMPQPQIVDTGSAFPDVGISGTKVADLTVNKLLAGTINSKIITLDVTDGDGDVGFFAGKSDFSTTDAGIALGIDDSDSNKAKMYLGDSTNYLYWDGTNLVLTGSAVVDGSITVGKLSTGNSPNLLPAEWADFEQYDDGENIGVVTNGTATCTDDEAAFGSKSMKMVASSADNYVYLGTSSTDYNIKLKPSTKYIVSAYIKGGAGSEQVTLHIKQDNATDKASASFDVTSSWARYYKEITTDASLTDSGILRIDNDDNGATIYIDAIQVEEASTTATTPEPSEWKPGKYALAYDPKKNLSLDLDFFWNHNMKQIADCDSDEGWADKQWNNSDTGVYTDDSTSGHYVEGTGGAKNTASVNYGGIHLVKALDLTKFEDGSASDTDDYIQFTIYIDSTSLSNLDTAGIWLGFRCDALGTTTNHFNEYYVKSNLSAGLNVCTIKKSSFTSTGSPDWSSIVGIDTFPKYTTSCAYTIDNIQLIRNDGDDNANPFVDLCGNAVMNPATSYTSMTIVNDFERLKVLSLQGTGDKHIYSTKSYKNFEASMSFKNPGGSTAIGIAVGSDGGSNWYGVGLSDSSNRLQIYKYGSGSGAKAIVSYTPVANQDYAIKVSVTDGVITGRLYTKGEQVSSIVYDTGSENLNGYVGIHRYNCNSRVYSFDVTEAGSQVNTAQQGTAQQDGGNLYVGSKIEVGGHPTLRCGLIGSDTNGNLITDEDDYAFFVGGRASSPSTARGWIKHSGECNLKGSAAYPNTFTGQLANQEVGTAYEALNASTTPIAVVRRGAVKYADQTPSADAYVDSANASTNYGTATTVYAQQSGGTYKYMLCQFSLSSLPTTAEKAIIVGGSVSGNLIGMEVYRNTASWAEGTVTWNNKPAVSSQVAGCCYDLIDGYSAGYPMCIDITELYNQWKAGTYSNYGVTVRAGAYTSGGGSAYINGQWLSKDSGSQTLFLRVWGTDSDYGEVQKADASDPITANTFMGFVGDSQNVSANADVLVRTEGVVDGFTGLTAGADYYLSDTAGTISLAPGTVPVKVGKAISATEILIDFKPYYSINGNQYWAGGYNGTGWAYRTILTGYRPNKNDLLWYVNPGNSTGSLTNAILVTGSADQSNEGSVSAPGNLGASYYSTSKIGQASYYYSPGGVPTLGTVGTVEVDSWNDYSIRYKIETLTTGSTGGISQSQIGMLSFQ